MSTGTSDQFKASSSWSIGISILLIILGIAAIALPFTASLVAETWIALLLFFAGVTKLIYAFQSRSDGGFIWKLLLGLLYIATGAVLWLYPLQGVLTLTLVLATFLVAEGLFEITLAFQLRSMPNWAWILGDGIITLILGGMIWFQFPFDAPWTIGTLVGVSILFSGISRLMLSLANRSA